MTARWTNHEIMRLRELFSIRSDSELAAVLPRHPVTSIRTTAYKLGLRRHRGQSKWRSVARQHVPVFDFGSMT